MTDTTTTTETVTVPKSVLGPIISTYVRTTEYNKTDLTADTKAALHTVFTPGPPAGDTPDTVCVDAEHAWHLAHNCDAMHVYGLDEEADETYQHPAVVAQHALMKLVADQAPETTTRLLAAAMQAAAAMQVRRR